MCVCVCVCVCVCMCVCTGKLYGRKETNSHKQRFMNIYFLNIKIANSKNILSNSNVINIKVWFGIFV